MVFKYSQYKLWSKSITKQLLISGLRVIVRKITSLKNRDTAKL